VQRVYKKNILSAVKEKHDPYPGILQDENGNACVYKTAQICCGYSNICQVLTGTVLVFEVQESSLQIAGQLQNEGISKIVQENGKKSRRKQTKSPDGTANQTTRAKKKEKAGCSVY
jgi:hypothetical protein